MKISSIDTITTKLLTLVLFMTLIPLIVILNFSSGIISDTMLDIAQNELTLTSEFAKLQFKNMSDITALSQIKAKELSDLIYKISGKDAEIYLISGGKLKLLASNQKNGNNTLTLDVSNLNQIRKNSTGFTREKGVNSYKIGKYSLIEEAKNKNSYLIYISTNENKFIYPVIQNSLTITIISVISLFLAIILAAFFARTITSPVLKLVSAAQSVSKGDLTYRLKIRGNDEIAQLSENFNKMAEALQKEEELKDNFIAALTHDLKVPLIAEDKTIGYFLQSSYGPVSEEQAQVLGLIKESNQGLLKMVNNILEVYKYDIGNVSLNISAVNIPVLVKKVTQELKALCEDKNIVLSVASASDEVFINADEIEIKRVLTNLIANAVENTDNNGSITCEILSDFEKGAKYFPEDRIFDNTTLHLPVELANKVLINIEDTGKGLSHKDINELFKKFALNKGRKPAGTGLGLYYSYQVVAKHKGFIWAESSPNKGSSFKFTLPVNN